MKKCGACGSFKEVGEFYVRRDTGGTMSICKKCNSAKCVARQRKLYASNPEVKQAAISRIRNWCELNPEKSKASVAAGVLRYQKRQTELITDVYARHSLVCWLGPNQYTSKMVKAQQARIQLHRSLNEK